MELPIIDVMMIMMMVSIVCAFEVTDFNQIETSKKSPDKRITIRDLVVPAGAMLDLTSLQPGTVVEFTGRVTFGYEEWNGTMIKVSGKSITIEGKPGNLIDGQGHRWWDGQGGNGGKKKPRLMKVTLEDSVIRGINMKNSPRHCFMANRCRNLLIDRVNIDIKDGDKKGGHNTDGFGVGASTNVTITNSKVHNQDDCFCSQSGKDVRVENLECVGGHGVSIGSVGSNKTVQNYMLKNIKVIKNTNGIRIKTRKGESGLVKGVTFENIELKDITEYGIIIQSNYLNEGPTGGPTPFPIEDIVIKNVHGNVSRNGTNIWVWVTSGSAKNWSWSSIKITGGQRKASCKGIPAGLNIQCGKK